MESLAIWFQESLLPYGAWGILLLAAMDSSFVPMPAFIDIAVMGAAALAPENALSYGAAAVLGSTIGVLIIYGLARSGRRFARTDGSKVKWAEEYIERRGTLALLVAALMPAPFPFKVVILASGYLRQPVASVVAGVGAGRLIRFGAEAFLAARYGDEIVATVQTNAPLVGLVLAILIALAAFVFYRRRPSAS